MVQLLQSENFSLFFGLLDLLHKAKCSSPPDHKISSQGLMHEQMLFDRAADMSQRDILGNRVSSLDDLIHSLWELLMILPTNLELKRRLESFDADESNNPLPQWCKVINTDSMFKLLYVLHIIDSLGTYDSEVTQADSQDEASSDSESSSSENEQTPTGSSEPLGWVRKFIKLGGLKHLYDRLMSDSLAVDRSSDDWKLDCVGYLLKLLTKFGCVTLSREEKDENEGKRRFDSKQKRHVFRARYKSIEGDYFVVIQSFNQVCKCTVQNLFTMESCQLKWRILLKRMRNHDFFEELSFYHVQHQLPHNRLLVIGSVDPNCWHFWKTHSFFYRVFNGWYWLGFFRFSVY